MANLAAKSTPAKTPKRDGYISSIVPKTITRTRADIATWKSALGSADNVDNPRRTKLYNLYDDALLDAHLTSQIELRMQHTLSVPFSITTEAGKVDDAATELLMAAPWVTELNRHILGTVYFGHSLVEFHTMGNAIDVALIPRTNVVPERGIILLDQNDTDGVHYRDAREFGTWVLEFGGIHDYGLINKAIPHALFKRFAQSCWSELCEIYGIPPRYLKTDTTDPAMLDRAESMLRDMGSAAYFVIDLSEEFQFAKGADTNGDVYSNLIRLCNNEMSMLFIGAVIGQDTANGNESKERSSMMLLDKLVLSDRKMVAGYWNTSILPALSHIGVVRPNLRFEYQQEEDLEKLWKTTYEAMQHMDVDPQWVNEKFGIKVTGARQIGVGLSARSFFE